MDQSIGIQYVVVGAQELINTNRLVGESLTSLQTKITGFSKASSGLDSFAQRFDVFGAASRKALTLNKRLEAMPELVASASRRVDELREAVARYNRTLAETPKNIRLPGVAATRDRSTPGSEQPGGPGGRGSRYQEPWGMSAYGFMGRWWLAYRGIQVAREGFTDILMGGARKEMAHALGELSAVSFDPSQKRQTEFAANQFSQRFWTITSEAYANAMSQTASAFDISRVGFENLQKLNESAIQFGAVSKMKPEQAAEFQSKTLQSLLAFQPKEVRAALLTPGGRADIRGFGNVNLGELGEKMAAQQAKAVEVTQAWGPGIQHAFRYILPSLMSRGWDIAGATALATSLMNAGFHPGQSGRGLKEVFEKSPEDMARMLMISTGRWTDPKMGAGARQANEAMLGQITPLIERGMHTPEGLMALLRYLRPHYQKFLGMDKSMIKDAGFSQNFLPIIKMLFAESYETSFGETLGIVRGATHAELQAKNIAQLQDAGTALERFGQGLSRLNRALADSPLAHGIAGPVQKIMNYAAMEMEFEKMMAREKMTPDATSKRIQAMRPQLEASYGKTTTDLFQEKMVRQAEGNFGWGDWMKHRVNVMGEVNPVLSPMTKWLSPDKPITDWWFNTIGGIRNWFADKPGQGKNWLSGIGAFADPEALMMAREASTLNNGSFFDVSGINSVAGWLFGNMPQSTIDPLASLMPAGATAVAPQPQPIEVKTEVQVPQQIVRVYIDGNEIRSVVQETIEMNKITNYHTFGSDPTGFSLGQ